MLKYSTKSMVLIGRYRRIAANGKYRRSHAAGAASDPGCDFEAHQELEITASLSSEAPPPPSSPPSSSFYNASTAITNNNSWTSDDNNDNDDYDSDKGIYHNPIKKTRGRHQQENDITNYHKYWQKEQQQQQQKQEIMDAMTLHDYHHHRMKIRKQGQEEEQQPYHYTLEHVDEQKSTLMKEKLSRKSNHNDDKDIEIYHRPPWNHHHYNYTSEKTSVMTTSSTRSRYYSSTSATTSILKSSDGIDTGTTRNKKTNNHDASLYYDGVHDDEVRDDVAEDTVREEHEYIDYENENKTIQEKIGSSHESNNNKIGYGRIWKSDAIYNPDNYDDKNYNQRFQQHWNQRLIDNNDDDQNDDDDQPSPSLLMNDSNSNSAHDEFIMMMMSKQGKNPLITTHNNGSIITEIDGISSSSITSTTLLNEYDNVTSNNNINKSSNKFYNNGNESSLLDLEYSESTITAGAIKNRYTTNDQHQQSVEKETNKTKTKQHKLYDDNNKNSPKMKKTKQKNVDDIVDRIIQSNGSEIRPHQYGLGVLHIDPSIDIQLLIDNYTVKSIASALREREDALQQAALLASNPTSINELISFLQIYHPNYVLQRRKQQKVKRTVPTTTPSTTETSSTFVSSSSIHANSSGNDKSHNNITANENFNNNDLTAVGGNKANSATSHHPTANDATRYLVTEDDSFENDNDDDYGKISNIPQQQQQGTMKNADRRKYESKESSLIYSAPSSTTTTTNYENKSTIFQDDNTNDNIINNINQLSLLDKTDPIYSLQYPECRNVLRKSLMRMPRTITSAHKKRAGVCIALCLCYNQPSILLQRRSKKLRSYPNEVCLPGGMVCDIQDPTIVSTSIREMKEEIGGINDTIHHPIEVLGILRLNWGEVQHITGVAVTPVVCYIGELPTELYPNPDEVSEIFTIPLKDLLKREYWIHRNGLAPIYVGGPYVIWGLTGYIIERFAKDILYPLTST